MNHSVSLPDDAGTLRFFSEKEANAMLPLVQAIAVDIKQLANELVDRKTRLDSIRSGSFHRNELYEDELAQAEKTIDDDKTRLQELLEELCDLGVHPHEPMKGIVGFPTVINDEETYLVWQIGDDQVTCLEEFENNITKNHPIESFLNQSDN